MALSRLAREFAAEISYHDWSDAPYRCDRAGHQRSTDTNRSAGWLGERETDALRMNVMWVVAQVLAHADPNLDPFEFADACGVDTRTPSGRPRSGVITAGIRRDPYSGEYDQPGGEPLWDDEDVDPENLQRLQEGTAEQRGRDHLWPADLNTRGFITPRGRNVHRGESCPKYLHAVAIARKRGRRVGVPEWTTTGAAYTAGKGICSGCWTA